VKNGSNLINMKLIKMLREINYALLAFIFTIVIFFVYSHIQLFGIWENFFFWLEVSSPLYLVSLILFSILFGLTISFQIYIRKNNSCSIKKEAKGASASGLGTISFIFVSSCPACATLGLIFIPISFVTVISQYNWLLNLISIGLLLFTLNYLGAFKN